MRESGCRIRRRIEIAMWKDKIHNILPLFGHRNWILIVDKAFPLQNTAGMTYVDTGSDLPDVLSFVMGEIKEASHIRPIVYVDKELSFMNDSLCPEVENLRERIFSVLEECGAGKPQQILHDEVFGKLDKAADLFGVLVVKTECLMPYTSIFIELDCGYWPAENEKKLRKSIAE